MSMFDLLGFGMADNYNERKVANYSKNYSNEKTGLVVDTCSVLDGDHPYETAIQHPFYNEYEWIIVEAYNTKKEAQAGHNKWVKIMCSKDLPKYLEDCMNAGITKMILDKPLRYKKIVPKETKESNQ